MICPEKGIRILPRSEMMQSDDSNFYVDVDYKYDAGVGLTEDTIKYISNIKHESQWITDFRLNALNIFNKLPIPNFLNRHNLNELEFDKIRYYLAEGKKKQNSWEEVPEEIKNTFERLGIPDRERRILAGVEAQFDSESAYSRIKDFCAKEGVIFVDSNEGLNKYEEIFRKYFCSVVPVSDNKFSALNCAVFSGGSFIYVPKGVKLKQPLQAHFRINSKNFGQFERTLIVVDQDAELTYMEGCTAPFFDTSTLHSAVVEVIALDGAKVQYITVQNWSNNVFNLVTKRGVAHKNAEIRWIDCNIGSRVTVKYPCITLKEDGAKGEILSIAMAGDKQVQDTGAKVIHLADNTSSNIVSKSISKGTGCGIFRGKVYIKHGVKWCRNATKCDALLINPESVNDTYPNIDVIGEQNCIEHEASVSKVSAEKIFYLQQRGLNESEATSLCVNGFVNDLVREFPIEYSVELKRLIDFEIEKSV